MTSYTIEEQEVAATRLLVVRRRASLSELSKVVPDACGAVWGVASQQPLAAPGRNVAVSSTPSGPVARTTHLGSYAGLYDAHVAVRKWCAANQYSMAGPNWEVYCHWSDDPAKLTTDIFYLLRA